MRKLIMMAAMITACGLSGYFGMALYDSRASAADPKPLSAADAKAKGIEMFDKVYGGIVPLPADTSAPFQDLVLRNLFATIWSRDVMSIRDRRLVLMGAIAAQGEAGTFGIQVRAALHKGELTPDQVNEIVLILTQYIGYPHTTQLLPVVEQAITEAKAKK